MTAVESSATSAMTDDKGDRTAVADLTMTDDCRVGHVSTVHAGGSMRFDQPDGDSTRFHEPTRGNWVSKLHYQKRNYVC